MEMGRIISMKKFLVILVLLFSPALSFSQDISALISSANLGDATAQFDLGRAYYYGNGVEKNPVEAFIWTEKAAIQGLAGAQHNLGFSYLNGIGVDQNIGEAIVWYQKAALQGHAKSQYILGSMYETGKGVSQNLTEAISWYQKAADQGNVDAKQKLKKLINP
jgi:TPR repeat protein